MMHFRPGQTAFTREHCTREAAQALRERIEREVETALHGENVIAMNPRGEPISCRHSPDGAA